MTGSNTLVSHSCAATSLFGRVPWHCAPDRHRDRCRVAPPNFLGVESRESEQSPGVVSGIDDLRLESNRRPVLVGADLELLISKPSSLSRSTRRLIRQRSDCSNCSDPVSSCQRSRYFCTMRSLTEMGSMSSSSRSPACRSKQLTRDVDPRDLQIVLTLPSGEPRLKQLARLGVDQVGGKMPRHRGETACWSADIAPEEPGQMESHEEHGEGVHEALRRAGRSRCERPPGRAWRTGRVPG